ncbi:PREDICTED: pre T-cell antigen receptor alpha, partial [Corvus brachyrhynchos]|uniref:pre T-cell antigen receptor alpha n=1 Tax=Corvus brachyrhynchos TaxID=85066 RepID=UPI0008167DAA
SPSAGRAAVPLPTLTRPLSMVLAGGGRAAGGGGGGDLAPSSGHGVWISGGNGSVLQSFAYGASQEDGGTVCSVSLLSSDSDPPRERELACHVGANRTSPSHSSSPIRITGNEEAAELCSTAGESLAPAWWEHQVPGVEVSLGCVRIPSLPEHGPMAGLERMWGAVGCLWQASPHPSIAVSPAHALAALLMGVRVVLLKVLLSDAVFTSILLAQS